MVEQKMAAASLYDDVLHDSENISWIGILPTRRNGRVQKSPANNVENSFNCKVKEDQGALPTVLDLAKAVEQVSLPFVWAWTTHFSFPRKCCVCCVAISKQRRIQFERCVAEPSRPSRTSCEGPHNMGRTCTDTGKREREKGCHVDGSMCIDEK